MTLRVVIDANVWVSAIVFPNSVPNKVIDLARRSQILALTSRSIVDQVQRALTKFSWSEARIALTTTAAFDLCEIVPDDRIHLEVIESKPSDNRILECAIVGKADMIVTGDKKHLLPIANYAGIPIVTPRALLTHLGIE